MGDVSIMKRALVSIVVLGACGDDGGGGGVSATAKLYNGATPAGVALLAPLPPPAPPADGKWLVSPNQ